jgi:hypothetical protein
MEPKVYLTSEEEKSVLLAQRQHARSTATTAQLGEHLCRLYIALEKKYGGSFDPDGLRIVIAPAPEVPTPTEPEPSNVGQEAEHAG